MKVIDYALAGDISCMFRKKIFIYGTGVYGRKTANVLFHMKLEIEAFCETNPQNYFFDKKKVISTETLIQYNDSDDVLVIIASETYHDEMINTLQSAKNLYLCTYYALILSLYLNYQSEGIPEETKKLINFFKEVNLNVATHLFFDPFHTLRPCYELLAKPSLVWIYQPGKVASATIYYSSKLKTLHMHSMQYAFNADEDMCKTYEQMLNEIRKRPIKIITGVREPISRDISAFFQGTDRNIWPMIDYGNSCHYLFGNYSDYTKKKIDRPSIKAKICMFEKSLNHAFQNMGRVIVDNKSDEFSWFDYEIKELLGVDVYAYPFDKNTGYTIIKQDNIQILIYKFEKLNQLQKVIGEFLGDPEFKYSNSNQADKKIYSYIYKDFKENVKLEKAYFNYYYVDNPKLQHFYTDVEIKQFMDKWQVRVL